jgi:hypothetical protein
MNAGDFELSDCWSSEQQPATYYRTAAAQARRLQADVTTPSVKQYLDKMIAHCERLAGKVEPGLSPARSATVRRWKVSASREFSGARLPRTPFRGGPQSATGRGYEELNRLSHEPWRAPRHLTR